MEASAARPARARGAPAEGSEWLRMLGGVAFAVGAVALYIRKSGASGAADWADFPLLLVAGVPCVLLFWLGISNRRQDGVERWRAVLMVTGVLLAPLALEQFREAIGGNESYNVWHFLVFSVTVALAAYAAFVVGAEYQAFLAAVAGILAWFFLWEWLLNEPGVSAFRWLFILLGLGYLAAALALRASDAPQGGELITAAGIVGVLVGLLGLGQAASGLSPLGVPSSHGQGFFWNLILLAVALASVAYGAAARARGPAYVGFFGLFAFALATGFELDALLKRESPDGSFAGWPLALLLIGGGALALGVAGQRGRGTS